MLNAASSFHGGINVHGTKDGNINHKYMIFNSQSYEGSDSQM